MSGVMCRSLERTDNEIESRHVGLELCVTSWETEEWECELLKK